MTQITNPEAIKAYRKRIMNFNIRTAYRSITDENEILRKWIKRQDKKIKELKAYKRCVEIPSDNEVSNICDKAKKNRHLSMNNMLKRDEFVDIMVDVVENMDSVTDKDIDDLINYVEKMS